MSEMVQAISTSMDLTQYKAMSSGLKIHKHSLQPENRTELRMNRGENSDLYFSIHARPNSFINGQNTHLSYNYAYTGTSAEATTAENCNGTSNFIRGLETLAGSTSLENLQNYNVLSATLDDISSAERGKTLGSILQDKSTTHIKRGFARSVFPVSGSTPAHTPRRVCVPLLSSVIGVNAENYFPVGRDVGLRLRLTFDDPVNCLQLSKAVGGAGIGYVLTDITLEIEYVEVSPQIYQTIANEADGVFKVSGVGIANFTNTIAGGAMSQSLLIPARYSSVRNFLTINRLQSVINNEVKNTLGGRTRDFITSYQYRIAGTPYPNLPVSCDGNTSAEALVEVIKSFHGHADLNMHVCFDRDDYIKSTEDGAFVFGIDFEEAGFSAKQLSGVNTTSGNVFLELGYSEAARPTVVDTFAFYDQIIEVDSRTGEVSISK